VYTLSASTCRCICRLPATRVCNNRAVKQEAKRAGCVGGCGVRDMSRARRSEGGGGGMVLSLINKAAGRLASFLCVEDLRNEQQLIV
jgi:hypothetical protein